MQAYASTRKINVNTGKKMDMNAKIKRCVLIEPICMIKIWQSFATHVNTYVLIVTIMGLIIAIMFTSGMLAVNMDTYIQVLGWHMCSDLSRSQGRSVGVDRRQ